MNIIEHLLPKVIFPIQIGPVNLSITNQVLVMWLAAALVVLFFYLAGRKPTLIPHKLQNAAEIYIEALWDNIEPIVHDKAWLPFFCALFSFIFFINLLGLFPGLTPPSSNINFTASLAIIIFLLAHSVGIKQHGLIKYLKSFAPSGIPWPVLIFIVPVEIVSQIARPFSLSVRLFANMFAGHAVMLTLLSLIFVFKSFYILPGPLIGNILVSAFEIFISLIQAFIFTFLSAYYIGSAIESDH